MTNAHRVQINNTIKFLKSIRIEKWEMQKEERDEFIFLQKKYGWGKAHRCIVNIGIMYWQVAILKTSSGIAKKIK